MSSSVHRSHAAARSTRSFMRLPPMVAGSSGSAAPAVTVHSGRGNWGPWSVDDRGLPRVGVDLAGHQASLDDLTPHDLLDRTVVGTDRPAEPDADLGAERHVVLDGGVVPARGRHEPLAYQVHEVVDVRVGQVDTDDVR